MSFSADTAKVCMQGLKELIPFISGYPFGHVTLLFHFVALTHHVLIACFVVAQVTSPTGQLVSSVPLEQTPAEEESRKSISRSFKGTMASSTERKFLFVIYEHTFGVCCGG